MRLKQKVWPFTLLVLPLFCCSCSMLLVNTVPTRLGRPVQAGADRQALAARLGQPEASSTSPLPAAAKRFPTNPPPGICDVYHVNGLMQMPGDPYDSDWNMYPALFFLTAGLSEVVLLPYVAVDLTVRSFRRYEFRAWYDCSDQLVAFEKRKRSDEH